MKRKGEINLEYSKRFNSFSFVIFKGALCLTFFKSVFASSIITFFFFFFCLVSSGIGSSILTSSFGSLISSIICCSSTFISGFSSFAFDSSTFVGLSGSFFSSLFDIVSYYINNIYLI